MGPGLGPVDPVELALRCPIEASAAVIRADRVTRGDLLELTNAGDDVVLWCSVAERGPVARIDAVLAEVRWDATRHGFDVASRVARLRALSRSRVGRSGPAAATIRRELLARMFLQGGSPPDGFEASELAGDDGLEGVVKDLQWTLERQAAQLASLWRGWPHVPSSDEFSHLDWPEDTAAVLQARLGNPPRRSSG